MDRREADPARAPALAIATGLGIGFLPWAPGTFGSGPGVLLYALVSDRGSAAVLVTLAVLVGVGTWAATRAERHLGTRDPGQVVIDEVAGQYTALMFLPPTAGVLICGFVLFRIFDILKPFPVRRLEALPGGSGIMADDLAAGVYANLVLQVLVRVIPDWMLSSVP